MINIDIGDGTLSSMASVEQKKTAVDRLQSLGTRRNSPIWPLACFIKGYHETQATKLIEQEIQTTIGLPSDTLLHATLRVGFIPNGPETPSLDCYPVSPLAAAQLLNALGTAKLIPERLQLINHWLSIKGGVKSIAFQGLSDMLRL